MRTIRSQSRQAVEKPMLKRPQIYISALLALIGLASVVNFFYGSFEIARDPFLLNYGEGISLLSAKRFIAGENLYPPIQREPYIYFAYPPVYPALCAVLFKFSAARIEVLRVFTVALEIIAGWLTFLCLIRLRIPRLMAGTFTCLLIGLFSVNKFHGLARLDFLQLAVVLAALHQLLVFMESPPVMRPTTCLFRFTCFSVLALLAKPTSILFLFGVGIFALLQLRGDRRIVAWLIAALVAVAALYAACVQILQIATHGEFLKQTLTYQSLSGWYTTAGWWSHGTVHRFLLEYWSLISLAGICVVLLHKADRSFTLLSFLWVINLFWFFVASFKQGSDVNYALELITWSVFIIVIFCRQALLQPQRTVRLMFHPLVLLAIVWIGYGLTCPVARRFVYLQPLLDAMSTRQRIDVFTETTSGLVIAEEPFFVAKYDKQFLLGDPFQLARLARQGIFDASAVVQQVEDRKIARIFLGPRLLSIPGMSRALQQNYMPTEQAGMFDEGGTWQVWEPLP